MISASSAWRFVAIAATAVAIGSPAFAQDISDSHLKASRAAIAALGATSEFDNILPQAAQAMKMELTSANPDQVQAITRVVDEQALKLAARRADLEREAATIYARVFSEAELNEITAFYNTAAGKKLLSDGNIAFRQIAQAAAVWQRGLSRDLTEAVGAELRPILSAAGAAPQAQQPAGQGAPATAPAAPAPAGQAAPSR